jgi:hypothetical protein
MNKAKSNALRNTLILPDQEQIPQALRPAGDRIRNRILNIQKSTQLATDPDYKRIIRAKLAGLFEAYWMLIEE